MKNVIKTNLRVALAQRLLVKGEEYIAKGKERLDSISGVNKNEAEAHRLASELRKFEATKVAELTRWKLQSYSCSVGEEASVMGTATTKFGEVKVKMVKGKVTLNHRLFNRTYECGMERIALELLVEKLDEVVLERGLRSNKRKVKKTKTFEKLFKDTEEFIKDTDKFLDELSKAHEDDNDVFDL